MKKLFNLSVLILLFLLSGVSNATAGDTYCSGTIGAITVSGNLVICESCQCVLNGTIVTGNVTVRSGGQLICNGAQVGGDLTADGAVNIQFNPGTLVDGNVTVKNSGEVNVETATITGNLQTENVAIVRLIQGAVIGVNLTIKKTPAGVDFIILDSQIGGNFHIQENRTGFEIRQNSIGGNFEIVKNTGAGHGIIIDTQIDGDHKIESNTIAVDSRWNTVGGNMGVVKNTGGIVVKENQITGNLECKDNVPAPTGGNNTVGGNIKGQCLGMAPAVVAVPNIVGLPQADAEAALTDVYLIAGNIATDYNDTVPEGCVISQTPEAGTIVEEDTAVDLLVSLGPGMPSVSITATPDTIIEGQSSELSWTSDIALTVVIDQGIGEVPLNGSISVTPTETTIYTITATGPGGTAIDSVTVTVYLEPSISMSAQPQSITAGESFVLTWFIENADSAIGQQTTAQGTIDEEIPLTGSNNLSPTETTTYTIIATGPGGTTSQSITVTVNIPAPIITLNATPTEIVMGSSSILSWECRHADSCDITPDIGAVDPTGSIEISPTQTTTYTLTATGAGGTSYESVTVVVTYLQPTVSFSANPTKLNFGDSSTLAWQVFLADSCEITPDIGAVDLSGAIPVSPTETTTYTLTATGPGGVVSKSVTIWLPDIDLEPVSMDVSNSATNGQSLEISGTIDVEIRNNGIRTINEEFAVILFEDVDNDSNYDSGIDTVLGTQNIQSSLPSGESIAVTIPVSGTVSFMDNRIFAFVDSGNVIKESNEANNLTHNMANCEYHPQVGSFNPVVEWQWTGSPIRTTSYQVVNTPAVGQLNDDNGDGVINSKDMPDIVFVSYVRSTCTSNGTLRAVSGDGSGELFTVTLFDTLPVCSPAIGDIDNDGLMEIVVMQEYISGTNFYAKIIAFENDGSYKWLSNQYLFGNMLGHGITLSDIDSDGNAEIICGRVVLNSDGSLKWEGTAGNGYGLPIAADIDLDGFQEIIAGNTCYETDGSIAWQNTIVGDGYTATGNFDSDPYPEIVLVTGGKAYLLEHNGEIIWTSDSFSGGGLGGPPCVADYDNDGEPEIGISAQTRYIVIETNGTTKWASPITDPSSSMTGSSVFDFEGDGSAEVVCRDEHYLRIFRGVDGVQLYYFPVNSRTRTEYPIIVDVDNDNNAEIITVADNNLSGSKHGVIVFGDASDTWVNTRKIWNQHAYHITNVNDDGTIPQFEANNWETYNNYRQNEMLNPFGCTDLSASMIRINRTNMPDAALLIVRIGNGGLLHVNPGAYVSFYNGDPSTGGILLGTVQTPSRLNPGEYVDLSLQWDLPVIDLYTIYVQVDDDGTGEGRISESDEANNTAVADINLGNQSPIADAGPDQTVFINDAVTLNGGNSSDPEGQPISYFWSIESMPDGSSAVLSNPDTADPSFTADIAGEYHIQLIVNDGLLDSGINMVVIFASPPITVPDVSGLPRQTAQSRITGAGLSVGVINESYSDTVAQGSVINQSPAAGAIALLNAPVNLTVSLGIQMVSVPDVTGMTLEDATAALTAASLAVGEITQEYINIQPAGLVFYQSIIVGTQIVHDSQVDLKISLGVWTGEDTQPPYVWISLNPDQVDIGNPVFITVTAADNVGVATTQLTINGQSVPLTNGQAAYLPQTGGFFTAMASATDATGLTGAASSVFTVINPYDTIAPIVLLDEYDCVDVTDLYSVTGRVYDSGGVTYTLSARRQGDVNWIEFGEGSGVNITGELGLFDPTVLRNGVYEIRLRARDLAGNTTQVFGCALVDGQLKVGQVILPGQDVEIPANGFPVTLEREFDSRDPDGDFGPGWRLPSSTVKPMTTRELGGGWAEEARGAFLTTYYLIEKYRHVVVIRFSDEEVLKFKIDITPKSSILYPISTYNLRAKYVPIDQTTGKLEALGVANDHLMLVGSNILEWGTDPYKPTRFKYTRPDGTAYVLNTQTGIESVTDVYGHTITYSASGIYHSSGAGIAIERGTGSRIEQITDCLGRTMEYHYDEDGMLVKVLQTGPEPEIFRTMNRYGYTAGVFGQPRFEDIIAPDGTILGRFEYDTADRMIGLIDGQGHRMVYGFDVPSHTQEITDRRGNTTVYEYNNKGYVTQKTDPEGNISAWTYDAFGNKLTETDPLGHTTTYTYDASGNMLSETDPLGNTTAYTYNDRNDVLTRTDPNGNATTYTYDSLGNKLTETDPLGHTTTYTYDASGNVLSQTDPLGQVTTYAYDASGNKVQEIAPNGKVTTRTYDGYGHDLTETITRTTPAGPVTMTTTNEYSFRRLLVRTVDPMGYETLYEYNPKRLKTAETDKNGARTEFEYDGNGNETAIHFADDTSVLTQYDGEGNRISTTDRAGRTTYFEYDAANRLTRVIHPDASDAEMVFDPAGRLVAAIDENGNETGFEYDAAGRRIAVIDALGNTVAFAHDATGNQTAMTDPRGATTQYEYDALNRQIRTIYPDGTFTATGYDALGRKISETDPSGRTTQFDYDEVGNLITVTNALGEITDYTYDEVGNRLTHTDPNGRTAFWEYDDLGRVVSHTLPLGMTESYTYDPMGNVLTHTDFNGDTTQYQYSPCCSRLTQKTYPDGSSIEYTYLGDGKRETVTDSRGLTRYGYDARGRLEQVTNPDGGMISYSYDAKGNRTSVTVASGTTSYTFDQLNRMASVIDPSGGITTYTYDANGNREQEVSPNGTIAEYTYDALNRLIYLENRKSTGDVISSYFYILGPAGNRLSVSENTGRVVNYTYDAIYRLVQEEIIDPVNGNNTIAYTYDGKGNRLTKTDASGVITYNYDTNDRLLTETGPAYVHTYSCDNNGNTISKSAAGESIAYSYDFENRLIGMETLTSTVAYIYDADGIRVGQNVDGVTTDFIVDKNRDYAQVLEERDNFGSLTVAYVYGDDLISQERGGQASYYHYDGLGSTRALTDASETVTDTYDYEAFGTLINNTGSTQNSYLFTGEQFDPNVGFYYLRARYYDQSTGRFMTTDQLVDTILNKIFLYNSIYLKPGVKQRQARFCNNASNCCDVNIDKLVSLYEFPGDIYDPISLHRYIYVKDNPTNYIDPSGYMFTSAAETLTVVSLISALTVGTIYHYYSDDELKEMTQPPWDPDQFKDQRPPSDACLSIQIMFHGGPWYIKIAMTIPYLLCLIFGSLPG